jgi:hypothetical protein
MLASLCPEGEGPRSRGTSAESYGSTRNPLTVAQFTGGGASLSARDQDLDDLSADDVNPHLVGIVGTAAHLL